VESAHCVATCGQVAVGEFALGGVEPCGTGTACHSTATLNYSHPIAHWWANQCLQQLRRQRRQFTAFARNVSSRSARRNDGTREFCIERDAFAARGSMEDGSRRDVGDEIRLTAGSEVHRITIKETYCCRDNMDWTRAARRRDRLMYTRPLPSWPFRPTQHTPLRKCRSNSNK